MLQLLLQLLLQNFQQAQGYNFVMRRSFKCDTSTVRSFLFVPLSRARDEALREYSKLKRQQRSVSSSSTGYVRRTCITMMPEGPEVRTMVHQLQSNSVGHRLINIQFLTGRYTRHGLPTGFKDFAKTMTQYQTKTETTTTPAPTGSNEEHVDIIQEWNCKGKFIYVTLDNGRRRRRRRTSEIDTSVIDDDDEDTDDFQRSILITLGMSGRFVTERVHRQDDRFARWYMVLYDVANDRLYRLYYHDQRNFGTLKFSLSRTALQEKLKSLGPDILQTDTSTAELFLSTVAAARNPVNVCKFLMDQKRISGVGNYILAEGLYRANIDPFIDIQQLNEDQLRNLFTALQTVAVESLASAGMTRENGGQYRTVTGERGHYVFQLQCYGRTTCAAGFPVQNEVGPHGRTIWYTDQQRATSSSSSSSSKMSNNHHAVVAAGDKTSASWSSADDDNDDDHDYAVLPKAKRVKVRIDRVDVDPSATTAGSSTDKVSVDGSLASPTSTSTTESIVEQLFATLADPGWRQVLADIMQSPTIKQLAHYLQQRRQLQNAIIYPPENDMFTALNLTPYQSVKVVIVGQDPYHGPGQSHGLAFSVQRGVRPPPSLLNIFREAVNDVGIRPPSHGNLEHWARQGVLLLNSVLTVERGRANSHANMGWEDFTDAIIRILNDQRDHHLVFLLWGNPAMKKASFVDESRHTVIRTSHPSPLGATKTNTPFLTSRCFSRVNQALMAQGQEPIDWNVL